MGCDIHTFAERKSPNGRYEMVELDRSPFDCRSYGLFGFLAGVRNYSDITPISSPRGIPADISAGVGAQNDDWEWCGHSRSWLSIGELEGFDYDSSIEDRRISKRMPGGWIDCGSTAEPGGGKETTYREFLGEWFFEELERLKAAGIDRVVFWFDN